MATPPTYGLTAEGYVAPTQEKIRAWLASEWKELFGANSTVEASSINGKLIDFATRIAVTYFEGGAGAANAGWFAAAPGVALEKILSLFAFPRLAASSSTVSAVLYGTDATIVNAGAIASVEVSKDKFLTTAGVTIGDDDSIYVVRIGDGISPGDAPSVTIAGTPYTSRRPCARARTSSTSPLDRRLIASTIQSRASRPAASRSCSRSASVPPSVAAASLACRLRISARALSRST